MKALTLTQPWATLVAIGAKKIETRSWNTTHRGPLAIHAAKGYPQWAKDICYQPHFKEALMLAGYSLPQELPTGVIVATCELISTHQVDSMDWIPGKRGWSKGSYFWEATEKEKAFGDYSIGRYMWFLENVVALPEPVPAKGALSLWECGLTMLAADPPSALVRQGELFKSAGG